MMRDNVKTIIALIVLGIIGAAVYYFFFRGVPPVNIELPNEVIF